MSIDDLLPEINPDDILPEIDPDELFDRKVNDVPIGTDLDSQGRAYIDLGLLKTHLHVMGLSGFGKSYFLELLCRAILDRGQGLTLIDPHGFLYDAMLQYISFYPKLAEKLILFNPTDVEEEMLVGFNPMQQANYYKVISKQVDIAAESVAKVWCEDSDDTPRLARHLSNALYPIIEGGYTFLEVDYFTWLEQTQIRDFLAKQTTMRSVQKQWDMMSRLPIREQENRLESLMNRLPKFIRNEMVRKTLGQTKNVLDFEDIFENQKILLVNLSTRGALSPKNADTMGVFLMNEMFHYAVSRTQQAGKQKPMFLVVDEFQNFLSPDAAAIIDQTRKFGLHGIFAHQRLQQLLKKGEDIYYAVKDGVPNKLIFSCSFSDAGLLVDDAYAQLGGYDLEEVKQEIWGTTVVNFREETRLITAHGHTDSLGGGHGLGSGSSAGTSHSGLAGHISTMDTTSQFQNTINSWNRGDSYQETEVPMIIPELDKELKSREFWSLEEQRYKKTVGLVRQPVQHAMLILPGLVKHVKIQTLLPYPENPEKISAVKSASYKHQARYYLPQEVRQREVDERQRKLEAIVEPQKPKLGQKPKIRVRNK